MSRGKWLTVQQKTIITALAKEGEPSRVIAERADCTVTAADNFIYNSHLGRIRQRARRAKSAMDPSLRQHNDTNRKPVNYKPLFSHDYKCTVGADRLLSRLKAAHPELIP